MQKELMRFLLVFLFVLMILPGSVLGQDIASTKKTNTAPGDGSDLAQLFPESTLMRLGNGILPYQRVTDFLVANQQSLSLSQQQVKEMNSSRSVLDGEIRNLRARISALYEANTARETLFAKEKQLEAQIRQSEAKFLDRVRGIITDAQVTLATRALFAEIRKTYGLDNAITFKPFVDQIQPTAKQLRQIQTLNEISHQELRQLLIESLKNFDQKAIAILKPAQQKQLKNDFQYQAKIRNDYLAEQSPGTTLAIFQERERSPQEERYFRRVEKSGLLAGEMQLGMLLGGFGQVSFYLLENKAEFKLTAEQLRQINKSMEQMTNALEKMAQLDEFQQLDSLDLPEKDLERLSSKFEDMEEEIIFKYDQQSMSCLQPGQLNQLKAAVLKDNCRARSLAWILSKKPFCNDLKLNDQQITKLNKIDRDNDRALRTVSNLAQEELDKDVLEILNAGQRKAIESFKLPSQ